MKKAIFIIFFLLICVLVVLRNNTKMMSDFSSDTVQNAVTALFPSPYNQMTVPYLRDREYKSSLGAKEKIGDNGVYTSYLTSYQSDGLKINALLTVPNGEDLSLPQDDKKRWPAIVFVHGYIPPTQYVTTEKYVQYVDTLARNGFVVLKIDLRGHGESEGRPGGGYYGSDYIVDTLNAYSALQNSSFVNPKAIGMWGHSMAGNTLLRSAVVKKDIPAIVIWAGAVYTYLDQRTYGIQDTSYRPPQTPTPQNNSRRLLFEKVGSPSASSPFWKQVAPTNYLNDFTGAIGLHHAADDDVVNVGYSRDLVTLLEKTDISHEYYEYESGGHNIDGYSFDLAIGRTVEFYKKYLK